MVHTLNTPTYLHQYLWQGSLYIRGYLHIHLLDLQHRGFGSLCQYRRAHPPNHLLLVWLVWSGLAWLWLSLSLGLASIQLGQVWKYLTERTTSGFFRDF